MDWQEPLQVSVDVGSRRHWVKVGRQGRELQTLEVAHTGSGFQQFFRAVEAHRRPGERVVVLAEGSGGWLRPLDRQIQQRGYELLQINHCKAARFREACAGPAKTDQLDAARGLQLLQLQQVWNPPAVVCEPVAAATGSERHLRALTQRRRWLVQERTRLLNHLQAQLQAVCPGLVSITTSVDNVWFLNFLNSRPQLNQLQRLRYATLLKIARVGPKRAAGIARWQRQAAVSEEAVWMSPLVRADVVRLLEIRQQIRQLEGQLRQVGPDCRLFQLLLSIPGFGVITSAELAAEIGPLHRFHSADALALYLGVAPLDYSSGQRRGSRRARLVNYTAKNALCTATGRHRQLVEQSQRFYQRKLRENGGRYAKAVRALARHLVRVIWSMAKNDREYEIRPVS